MIYFFSGGARSGKSRLALKVAKSLSEQVLYLATLSASDEEMMRRIERHQAERPAQWRTLEVQLELAQTLQLVSEEVVLIDCLSGFVANLVLKYQTRGEEAVQRAVTKALEELCSVLQASKKTLIIVSNEVGSGVVPETALGRWFRDALGWANQRLAQLADVVVVVMVGMPLCLKGSLPRLEEVDHVS
jgi:adenosyl cobinamide kinase/adenosyl cobinamide phosphate guanylyltransferase